MPTFMADRSYPGKAAAFTDDNVALLSLGIWVVLVFNRAVSRRRSTTGSVIVPRRLRSNTAILHRHFHHAALVQLAHGRAIQLLPRCRTLRHGRNAVLFAPFDFLIGDEHIAATF